MDHMGTTTWGLSPLPIRGLSPTAYVLFRLVYTCGLRPGEALGLHIADVDREDHTGTVPAAHPPAKRKVIDSDLV